MKLKGFPPSIHTYSSRFISYTLIILKIRQILPYLIDSVQDFALLERSWIRDLCFLPLHIQPPIKTVYLPPPPSDCNFFFQSGMCIMLILETQDLQTVSYIFKVKLIFFNTKSGKAACRRCSRTVLKLPRWLVKTGRWIFSQFCLQERPDGQGGTR